MPEMVPGYQGIPGRDGDNVRHRTLCDRTFDICGRPIFSVFIPEEETIRYGVTYLKILGLSQLFMCTEAVTAGAFNGLGKTVPPSVVGITLNALRIPTALILSSTALGLDGVWWAISVSSMFKGTLLPAWYIIMLKRNEETRHLKLFGLSPNRSTADTT